MKKRKKRVKREAYPILNDPIEKKPEYKKIFRQVDQELEDYFKDTELFMGRCHMWWGMKQDILRKRYGIEWKSPVEMNPNVIFD